MLIRYPSGTPHSICFYLDFTACQDNSIHFEPSQSLGGVKTGDPQEKPRDHPQAELGLSHMWPELGWNPQQWDDEQFRALKISRLNHPATGADYTVMVHERKLLSRMQSHTKWLSLICSHFAKINFLAWLFFMQMLKTFVCSSLTLLSTIFQSYHDSVWLQQGAQCSIL